MLGEYMYVCLHVVRVLIIDTSILDLYNVKFVNLAAFIYITVSLGFLF